MVKMLIKLRLLFFCIILYPIRLNLANICTKKWQLFSSNLQLFGDDRTPAMPASPPEKRAFRFLHRWCFHHRSSRTSFSHPRHSPFFLAHLIDQSKMSQVYSSIKNSPWLYISILQALPISSLAANIVQKTLRDCL